MKIGITGSIACGKSAVISYLSDKGYKVYDADKISYFLTQKPNLCYNRIVSEFGEEILDENKEINRKKLGNIVFNNKDKKKLLESIIHPEVINEINKINDEICFVEVPLLYEAKIEDLFDKIIVVASSKEKQIERLRMRNGLAIDEAINRINNQMDINEKIKKADYVVYNNDLLDNLYKQIDNILKGIR